MSHERAKSDATVRREEFEALKVTVGRLRIDLDEARDRLREYEQGESTMESRLRDIERDVGAAEDKAWEAFHLAEEARSSSDDIPVETV